MKYVTHEKTDGKVREPKRSHKEIAKMLNVSPQSLRLYIRGMPEIDKFYVHTMSKAIPYYKLSDIPKIAEHIKVRLHIRKTRHLKVKNG